MGRIISKHAENFRVDIGSAHAASLSSLAFERTVKKNRPSFEESVLAKKIPIRGDLNH